MRTIISKSISGDRVELLKLTSYSMENKGYLPLKLKILIRSVNRTFDL